MENVTVTKKGRTAFTLDTNCMIDLDEQRPGADAVRALLASSERGATDLAMVASSASERQPDGSYLGSLRDFNNRRSRLGLGSLRLLPSLARWNVTFFDNGLGASAEGLAREALIYGVLFPASPHEWADYAASKGAEPDDFTSPSYLRWRNQILDAQALWAHDFAGRKVFVTSDKRLWTISAHPKFPDMVVVPPAEAALMV